ncbi:hypothetical protein KFE98_17450 [bacterium SCSIO 12741]|nr:hypothetical protein KFE98_17450 [bacterium SCSIO 12741]
MQTAIPSALVLFLFMALGGTLYSQSPTSKNYPDGKMIIEIGTGGSQLLDYQGQGITGYDDFGWDPLSMKFMFGSEAQYFGFGYSVSRLNGYNYYGGIQSRTQHRLTFETEYYLIKSNRFGLILNAGLGNYFEQSSSGFTGHLGIAPSLRVNKRLTAFARSSYHLDLEVFRPEGGEIRRRQLYSLQAGVRIHPFLHSSTKNRSSKQDSIVPRTRFGVELGVGLLTVTKPEYHPEPELENYERAFYIQRRGYPFAGLVVGLKNRDLHSVGIGYANYDENVEYRFFGMPISIEDAMFYYKYDYTPFKKEKDSKKLRFTPYVGARAFWNRKQFDLRYSKPYYSSDYRYHFWMESSSNLVLLQLSPSIKLRNARFFAETAFQFNMIGWSQVDYEYFREDVYTRPLESSVNTTYDDRSTSEFLAPDKFMGKGYFLHDVTFKVGFLF